MRIRLLIAGVAAALVIGLMPSPAGAQTDGQGGSAGISAVVTSLGYRAVTTASVTAMTSSLNSQAVTGTYAITVTELLRNGALAPNGWTVTGSLTDDLQLTGGTPNVDEISKANVSVVGRTTTVPVGNDSVAASLDPAAQPLSSAVLLARVTQQDKLYSGAYALSGTVRIDPPAGTKTGTYTGTLQVDLTN